MTPDLADDARGGRLAHTRMRLAARCTHMHWCWWPAAAQRCASHEGTPSLTRASVLIGCFVVRFASQAELWDNTNEETIGWLRHAEIKVRLTAPIRTNPHAPHGPYAALVRRRDGQLGRAARSGTRLCFSGFSADCA